MTDPRESEIGSTAKMLQLMAWTSSSFPTGSFAYSAGLESAVASRSGIDETWLCQWLDTLLTRGTAWNDAVLVVLAINAAGDEARLNELDELCLALANGEARWREARDQGHSFCDATTALGTLAAERRSYPVAFGAACATQGIDACDAVAAFLQGFVNAQLQCAIRLSVIGQFAAARLLAAIASTILEIARRATTLGPDDLGGCAVAADIAALRHQHLPSRMFLS